MNRNRLERLERPKGPLDEFPKLTGFEEYVDEIVDQLIDDDYDGLDESEENVSVAFRQFTNIISNAMSDMIDAKQEVFRDTTLGIIIAAKAQFSGFDSAITDQDVIVSIDMSRYISACIDELQLFENKYKADATEVFDFSRNYLDQ